MTSRLMLLLVGCHAILSLSQARAGEGPVFAEHFLEAKPSLWTIQARGAKPGLMYQDGSSPGFHFQPISDATAFAEWPIGSAAFELTADLELLAGEARGWGLPGAAIAVCSAPPDEMKEDDVAIAFAAYQEGMAACIRRGGLYHPDAANHRYRDRGTAPRYVLNFQGGGGHHYSARWPGRRLEGTRVRFRIVRRAKAKIHFEAYLLDGLSDLPWWEGDFELPDELADTELRCVAVRTVLAPSDFEKLAQGQEFPGHEIRGRFHSIQGRALDGPPMPEIESIQADEVPLKAGAAIVVSGRHFDSGSRVLVAGEPAQTTRLDERRLRAVLPELPDGVRHRLEVVTAAGLKTGYGPGLFCGSWLDRVEPREALPRGGDVVTVFGGGFDRQTQFFFGERPATTVEILDCGRARVTVPPGEAGPAEVAARSGDRRFQGDPAFGYAPHPYLWYAGKPGLEDLRKKFREPMFADYRAVILRLPQKPEVEVRDLGEEAAALPSAPVKPRGEGRRAWAWHDRFYFDLDLDLTGGKTHQVALYAFDHHTESWHGPELKIEVLDAGTHRVLDWRRVRLIQSVGACAVWNVRGHVLLRVRSGSQHGALASALFLDPAADRDSHDGAKAPTSRDVEDARAEVQFVRLDKETGGDWKDAYGKEGYLLAGEKPALPGHARVRLQRFPANELAATRGLAKPIYASLWNYLLNDDAPCRERLRGYLDMTVRGDTRGWMPTDGPGFPGMLRRKVVVGEFYSHTIEAVATAYDALFPELSPQERSRIGQWLDAAVRYYEARVRANDWWYANNPSNTIAIGSSCNGIAALARRYSTSDWKELIDLATGTIHNRYRGIADDGGCVEGTLYWNYAMTHQVMFGHALRNALGDDRGMLTSEKLGRTHRFVETALGGDGTMFPFNDSQPWLTGPAVCASLGSLQEQPLLLWTADRIMADCAARRARAGEILSPRVAVPAFLFRSRKVAPAEFPGVPNVTHLQVLHWGALRSDGSRFMPELVVGIKGKDGAVTHHANPDLGGFAVYARGENFILDPGYFQSSPTEENTLLIGEQGPDRKQGIAHVVASWEEGDRRAMVVDCTKAYPAGKGGEGVTAPRIERLRRHFVLSGDRAVVLLDEVVLAAGVKKPEVTMQLQCAFEPQIDEGRPALAMKGRQSRMAVTCDGPAIVLATEARQWKNDWVYHDRGFDTWYTVRGTYRPDAARPMVTVFVPYGGDGPAPAVRIERKRDAIDVSTGGKRAARFVCGEEGWSADRP